VSEVCAGAVVIECCHANGMCGEGEISFRYQLNFLSIVFSGELKRVLIHLSFLLLFALLLSLFVLVVSTYTLRALYLAVS